MMKLREKLDDILLPGRAIRVAREAPLPNLLNRGAPIEAAEKLVRHRVDPKELIVQRIEHEKPSLSAEALPADFHSGPKAEPPPCDPVPVFAESSGCHVTTRDATAGNPRCDVCRSREACADRHSLCIRHSSPAATMAPSR